MTKIETERGRERQRNRQAVTDRDRQRDREIRTPKRRQRELREM